MFTLVATIKAIRWIFKKHPCMLDIHTTPSAPVSRIGFNGRHTIMRAFFSTYFATIIHDLMCTIKPISIFFTVLNIPLLPSFGVHIDYLNITLCLLDLFHGSNAVITVIITGVMLLDLLFLILLLKCLDYIFGLGFLGLLLGAALILATEDDLNHNRFGAPAVFIGVG